MGNTDNRFVWYELATTDTEAAKAFYTSVMGWSVAKAEAPGSSYRLFTAGGAPVAGLMELPEQAGVDPQWLGYVGVGDVDSAAGLAASLGGSILVPPTDVPNVSRFSVIADSQKAALALIKGRERSQEQPLAPPGRVGWRELHTSDLETAFTFYHELLGWQNAETHEGWMGAYRQFSTGGVVIGGMRIKQNTNPSAWLYYFIVTDLEAALRKVEAGGGRLLFGPMTVQSGVRIVNCADPTGAVFGLMDRRQFVAIGCYAPRNGRPG